MKTCSKCSRENPDDVAFCVFCGNKFAVLCPNCGRENPVDVAFCGYCGTPRTNLPTTPEYVICPTCNRRQLVGLGRCSNCLSPLIVNDKPGHPPPVQPVVSSKPVAPTSLETPPAKTISPPLSVWRVAMIPAAVFTGLAAIASIYQYYKYPAELMGSLLIGIPASFIGWWLIFIFFIYILRKTEGKKWARVGAILVVIIFLCILFIFGASQAGGGTFFAPTATPTRTPRPTPTKIVEPICNGSINRPFFCTPTVEITSDKCFIDKGNVIMQSSVKNVGTTTIKNLLIIGLVCDNNKGCEPISYPPGFTQNQNPNLAFAFAQSDWYSIYDLSPREEQAFRLEVVLPPNYPKGYCTVEYFIP